MEICSRPVGGLLIGRVISTCMNCKKIVFEVTLLESFPTSNYPGTQCTVRSGMSTFKGQIGEGNLKVLS